MDAVLAVRIDQYLRAHNGAEKPNPADSGFVMKDFGRTHVVLKNGDKILAVYRLNGKKPLSPVPAWVKTATVYPTCATIRGALAKHLEDLVTNRNEEAIK